MKNSNRIYDIGLDIGTGSVGYSVIDENGKLLKKKSKNLWGSRIFDTGSTAEKTRLYRGRRRLINRKKRRVILLQNLLSEEIRKTDPDFFMRLKESMLESKDSSYHDMNILFNDKNFSDADYYNQYPTIFHLRRELAKSKEVKDIRMIYLALHHIVKNRGNFLYEGQNIEGNGVDIKGAMRDLLSEISILMDITIDANILAEKLARIMSDTSIRKA